MSQKTPQLNKTQFALLAARRDFLCFGTLAYKHFQVAKHHKRIAEVLEDIADPNTPPRKVLISLPPRHSKSLLVSELFVPYFMGKHPAAQVLTATNAGSLTKVFGRRIRNMMETELYKMIFPGTSISKDSHAATEFDTDQGGSYFGTSIDAQGTGRNAGSLIIIDDPIRDMRQALSPTFQQSLIDWYASVISTRQESTTSTIIVQTRWCSKDLIGMILDSEEANEWIHISMPAETDGIPLWPEKFSIKQLHSKKRMMGSSKYSSLYLQEPIESYDSMIQLDWFNNYTKLPEGDADLTVISYDTASKDKKTSDNTAATVWKVYGTKIYLIETNVKKMKFPDLKKSVYKLAEKHEPDVILIEDKSSGIALIQDLKEDRDFKYSIIPINPTVDKVTRMSTASPAIEAGDVHLPKKAHWLADFEIDIAAFPFKGRDTGDSVSQFLNWFKEKNRKKKFVTPIVPVQHMKSNWI